MYRDKERYGQDPKTVLRSKSGTFNAPLSMPKEKAFVFTCSWSDFFIKEADAWRPEAWEIIKATPHLTYQILTKRPERIRQCLPEDWGEGYKNVWIGVSVENQETFNKRASLLSDIPSKVRFFSFEPLIGEIDLYKNPDWFYIFRNIQWSIIGGESGNETGKYRYRECKIEWIEKLQHQLKLVGISVFIKQLGTHISKELNLKDRTRGNIKEFPKNLKSRDYPNI